MRKLIVMLFVSVAMLSGCGESEEERQKRELMEAAENVKDMTQQALDILEQNKP
jgi:uncharacterized lipoprotein